MQSSSKPTRPWPPTRHRRSSETTALLLTFDNSYPATTLRRTTGPCPTAPHFFHHTTTHHARTPLGGIASLAPVFPAVMYSSTGRSCHCSTHTRARANTHTHTHRVKRVLFFLSLRYVGVPPPSLLSLCGSPNSSPPPPHPSVPSSFVASPNAIDRYNAQPQTVKTHKTDARLGTRSPPSRAPPPSPMQRQNVKHSQMTQSQPSSSKCQERRKRAQLQVNRIKNVKKVVVV
jgi:hypothetical protein